MVDAIVPRLEMKAKISSLLKHLTRNRAPKVVKIPAPSPSRNGKVVVPAPPGSTPDRR